MDAVWWCNYTYCKQRQVSLSGFESLACIGSPLVKTVVKDKERRKDVCTVNNVHLLAVMKLHQNIKEMLTLGRVAEKPKIHEATTSPLGIRLAL